MDRDGQYELLAAFDGFCETHSISYFAVDGLLVDAIVYGKLAYAEPPLAVGMLREEFDRLRMQLTSEQKNGHAPHPIALRMAGTFWRPEVRLEAAGNTVATLSVKAYDRVTDDYDLTRVQLQRLKALGRAASLAPAPVRNAIGREAHRVAALYAHEPAGSTARVAHLAGGSDKAIPLEAVAQTAKAQLGDTCIRIPGGTRIRIPGDPTPWIEPDPGEARRRIRAVQRDALTIVAEIDRLCRRENIGYFMSAGTLLGAMRHGGFIPWDDDVDLCMMRPDYERFVRAAASGLPGNLVVQTRATDPETPYLYTKIRMRGTEYTTPFTAIRDMHRGISVDVFPFDPAPPPGARFDAHLARARQLERQHESLVARKVPDGLPRRRARNLPEAAGHAAMRLRHARYERRPLASTQRAFDEHAAAFADDPEATWAASYLVVPCHVPLESLLPYRELPFEGLQLMAPADPGPLLESLFGDWKQLPPEHLRRGHRVVRWKTSDGQGSDDLPGQTQGDEDD